MKENESEGKRIENSLLVRLTRKHRLYVNLQYSRDFQERFLSYSLPTFHRPLGLKKLKSTVLLCDLCNSRYIRKLYKNPRLRFETFFFNNGSGSSCAI